MMTTTLQDLPAESGDCPDISQSTIPSDLQRLEDELSRLSWLLSSVSVELPQLVRLATGVLEAGYQLTFNNEVVEISPASASVDDSLSIQQHKMLLPAAYSSLAAHLRNVLTLQQTVIGHFACLPHSIAAKLPTKQGSLWRSYYLRECLDIMHRWPADVEARVPFLDPVITPAGLVSVATPKRHRAGFPLHERFERLGLLLHEAVREIQSIRYDTESVDDSTHSRVAAGEVMDETGGKERRNRTKLIKPTPQTLTVIRLIQKDKSNNEVQNALEKELKIRKSIKNIRQIRSRYTRGEYSV